MLEIRSRLLKPVETAVGRGEIRSSTPHKHLSDHDQSPQVRIRPFFLEPDTYRAIMKGSVSLMIPRGSTDFGGGNLELGKCPLP